MTSDGVQQAVYQAAEGLIRSADLYASLRSAGCLTDSSSNNKLLVLATDLANTLPKRGSLDNQIDLKITRHRRLLKTIIDGSHQLPRNVFQELLGNDEILSALRAIRAAELSVQSTGYVESNSVARDRPIAALLEGTEGSRLKQVAASTLASLLSSSAAIVRSGGDFPPDMPSDSLFYGVPLSSLPALLSSLPTAVSATPDNLYGGGPRGDTLARVVEVKTAVDLLRGVLDAAESRRQDHRASQVPLVCLGGHLWTCSKAARRAAVALCRAASEAVPLAAAHAGEDVAHAMLVSAVALGGAVLDMSASLRAALSQRGGGGAEGGVQAVWGEADTRGAVEERYEADKRDVLGHLLDAWQALPPSHAKSLAQRDIEQLCFAHGAHAPLLRLFTLLGSQQSLLEDYLKAALPEFRAVAFQGLLREGRERMLLSLPGQYAGEVLEFLTKGALGNLAGLRWMHEVEVAEAGGIPGKLPADELYLRASSSLLEAGQRGLPSDAAGPASREGLLEEVSGLIGLARVALVAGGGGGEDRQAEVSRVLRLSEIRAELGVAGSCDARTLLRHVLGDGFASAAERAAGRELSAKELASRRARFALEVCALGGPAFQKEHVKELRGAWQLAATADEEAQSGDGMDDGDAVLPWASRLFFGRQRGGASAVSIEEVEEVVRGVVTDGITATRMIEGVRGQAVAV